MNLDDTLPSHPEVESPRNSYPAGHYFLPTFSDGLDSPESPLDLTSYRDSPILEQNLEMDVEETPDQRNNNPIIPHTSQNSTPSCSTLADTNTSASEIPNEPLLLLNTTGKCKQLKNS